MDKMIDVHKKYMEIALQHGKMALTDGEFPVGCVIEFQGKIVASGKRKNSHGTVNETDHAEILALRHLLTSYANIPMEAVTVYSTLEPCLMCYSTLLINGIRRFVYAYEDVMGGGTNLPLEMLAPLYRELKPLIIGAVLRQESLLLFQKFFSSQKSSYLQDTLLANFTLQQP